MKSRFLVYSRLILVEGRDNGEGDNDYPNNNGKDLEIVKKVKINIITHKNKSRTRSFILISFYLNIIFFIKTYNI